MNRETLKGLVLYGIFGVLTTILAIFIYWFVTRFFGVGVVPGSIISWVIAVLFAYCTNRKYVFHSQTNSIKGIIHEAYSFFMCRIATGIMDVVIMYVFVDLIHFPDMPVKIISNILVIIFNYVGSKLLVFKKGRMNS